MKVIGWIIVIISALIIIYNVTTTIENKEIASYNNKQAQENPWTTVFSGGGNLKEYKPCYTFKPPYTGFELTVIAAGVIGVVILFAARGGKNN